MATTALKLFTLDETKYGMSLARTLRVIAKLHYDWTKREGDEGSKQKYLNAIYFDKLAELFCRTWDILHDQGEVRYPSTLMRRRGFHGPGRAMKIFRTNIIGNDPYDRRSNKYAYTTEIIDKLKPSIGDARIFFRLVPDSSDPDCKVYSELVDSQWDSWIADNEDEDAFLKAHELQHVIDFSDIIKSMNKNELRAIGTHFSRDETIEDIKFNLRNLIYSLRNIKRSLQGSSYDAQSLSNQAVGMSYIAFEVKRKSGENRADYASARKKVESFGRDCSVKKSLLKMQSSCSEIWDDITIKEFMKFSDIIVNLSLYFNHGLFLKGLVPSRRIRGNVDYEGKDGMLSFKIQSVDFLLPTYKEVEELNIIEWINKIENYVELLMRFMPSLEERRIDNGGIL